MRATARFQILLILLAGLILTGCVQTRSVVGVWESAGVGSRKLELKEDGSFTLTITGVEMVAITGRFSVEKTRLSFTDIGLQGMAGLPFIDATLALGTELPTKMETTFSWKNNDEVSIEGGLLFAGAYKGKLINE